MPELPEVETVRAGLAPALESARILHAETFRPDLRWPLPKNFAQNLTGRTVLALRRRSKYLLADLDAPNGEDAQTWITHLGMSGRMLVKAKSGANANLLHPFAHDTGAKDEASPHNHVRVETDRAVITYNDPRRFGAMDLHPTAKLEAHKWLASLGPEPLGNGFNAQHLQTAFAGKSASIKSALLDQKIVAGLGNIYVCEALWRAGVNPKREAGGVSAARLEKLVKVVREVLADAIEAGGSSLKDYRQANGDLGYFQHNFAVYGRTGEACKRSACNGSVMKIAQSGRSSFYCPKCQK